MKKRYTLMAAGLLAISFSGTILTGCVEQSSSQSKVIQKAKTTWVNKLKKLATQKQSLTEKLWRLQNTKIIALNQGNFKTLSQIKKPLFETQTKLDNVTNKMATWNKVLRHHYHHAVLDNGQEINTWTLLKTDDDKSNHQRAHILINKLRKLQKQQININETLWDDQNQITNAINHNNQKALTKLETKYFKDRKQALPIANQIDMLTQQIVKFTTSLQKASANIQSEQTFNDWVIFQTISRNNQQLNSAITPTNPNNDTNTTRSTTDEDEDTNHTTSDEDETTETHSNTSDEGGSHATADEGGGGEATETAGGGAHGE